MCFRDLRGIIELNYFAVISFFWAFIGLSSRVMIFILGKRWNDWEENVAYTDEKPKWIVVVHVLAIALILFTWYMVFRSDVAASWVIASLMTLILVKVVFQLFKYAEFKAYVKKIMHHDKMFCAINIAVVLFSLGLIGLGVFYMM